MVCDRPGSNRSSADVPAQSCSVVVKGQLGHMVNWVKFNMNKVKELVEDDTSSNTDALNRGDTDNLATLKDLKKAKFLKVSKN